MIYQLRKLPLTQDFVICLILVVDLRLVSECRQETLDRFLRKNRSSFCSKTGKSRSLRPWELRNILWSIGGTPERLMISIIIAGVEF